MKKLQIPQIFDTGECPFCGSSQIRITKTRRPYRFYTCGGCKNVFKGVMIFLAYNDALEQAADLDKQRMELARYGL